MNRYLALFLFCVGLIGNTASTHAATYAAEVGPQITAAYPWEDTSSGTVINLNQDNCSSISLGFNFTFGGSSYSSVGVCSNGVLQLGGATFTSGANSALPVSTSSVLMLPFWDDLNPQVPPNNINQGIRYLSGGSGSNRYFTVTYLRIPRYCPASSGCSGNRAGYYTVQVTLFQDGRFVYRYGYTSASDAPGRGSGQPSDVDAGISATIGYQISSSDYIQYSYNTASVYNGTTILWRPSTQQKLTSADSICGTPTQVSVVFATTVNKASAETAGNYQIITATGSTVAVNSAALASDNQTVTLTLASASTNQIYIVRANGVQTTSGALVYDAQTYTTGSAGASGVIGDYFAHGQAGSDADDIFPYFSNINGRSEVVQNDATINFSSAGSGFFPGGNVHYYSTRWLGYIVPTTTAKYCLSARGDDGVRVYLNGSKLIDGWFLQSATWYTAATPVTLNAGQYYPVQMEFYERGGETVAALNWIQTTANSCSGNPPTGSATVPTANLYSCKVNSGPSAFRIAHNNSAINCSPSPVTITAVDASGNAVSNYTGTITITTSTAHGTWTLNAGSGSFSAGGTDSGQASYTFAAADNGRVILNLSDTHPESININVASGVVREDSNYDANLIFRPTGLRFVANGVADIIPSQIAGRTFSSSTIGSAYTNAFQLQAIGTDPSNNQCTALLTNGAQTVNIATECQNPSTCLSNLSIGGASINRNAAGNVSNYTALTLNFSNGVAALGSINYADVGQLRLYANTTVTIGGQNTVITGTSNSFVAAPFGFCIDPAGNPNAVDANSSVFSTAGSDFSTVLKAVAWESGDDSNNDGVANANADLCTGNATTPSFGRHISAPAVTINSSLQQPAGGNAGSLTGNTTINTAFTTPTSGEFQATLNWNEAGIVALNAQSINYLNSGLTITGQRANVGRFIPHHFAISSGTLTNRSDTTCSASPFTYLAEPLALGFSLQAQNATNAATQNYVGSFAKLQNFSDLHTTGISAGTPLTPLLSGNLTPNWNSGTWNINTNVYVNKPTPRASYLATAFGVAPSDSDNVIATGFDLITTGATADHVKIGTSIDLLYGRLRLDSASGPSDLDLPIPVAAEYWNNASTAFLINYADNCTAINGTMATRNPTLGATQPIGSATLSLGRSNSALIMTAPGAGIYGNVNVTVDLTGASNYHPWLRFDWDNNASTPETDPTATASFGTYRGSDRVIYWRETQ